MSCVASSGDDHVLSARESLAAPVSALDVQLAALRAAYERVGPPAVAVARALVADRECAEQIVIEAFAGVRFDRVGLDETHDLRRILARVITLCEQSGALESATRSGLWSQLPLDQRVPLALTVLGGCSLNEVVVILAADRSDVARTLTHALRAAARFRSAEFARPDEVERTG